MSEAAAGEDKDGAKDGAADPKAPYSTLVTNASQWAVVAVGAVGAAAVTKLSLDRLGKGELDAGLIALAYTGLIAFTLGVLLLVSLVVWQVRASRVTLAYMLGKGRTPKKLREFFDKNPYLLGGQPSLNDLRERLNAFGTIARPLKEPQLAELRRLLMARAAVLETGVSERTRIVNAIATPLLFLGAIMATAGAATFALATNRDQVLRTDRLAKEELQRKEVISGDLLPKTPTSVVAVIPSDMKAEATTALGSACEQSSVEAVLFEVTTPPAGSPPQNVYHVVTERTEECKIAELWLPPANVVPRLAEPEGEAPDANANDQEEPTVGPE